MKKLRFVIPLLAFLGIIFFLATSILYKGTYLAKDLIEEDLPNIQLYSHNEGQKINIHSIKDKVYILNIFASWCSYCRKEKPLLAQVKKKYSLPVYGVLHFDKIENIDKNLIQSLFKDIFLDSEGKLVSYLKTEGIPESLIIRNNKIIYHLKGPFDKAVLNGDIYKVLDSLKK